MISNYGLFCGIFECISLNGLFLRGVIRGFMNEVIETFLTAPKSYFDLLTSSFLTSIESGLYSAQFHVMNR